MSARNPDPRPASTGTRKDPAELESALAAGELAGRLEGRRPAVFLDYDGTLTPIVARPELAVLSDEVRNVLEELASRVPVVIVSGRDRADVAGLVRIEDLVYAGSHGFDITGPQGLQMEAEKAGAFLPAIEAAGEELDKRLASVPGSQVERKRFAISVHYRNVAEEHVAQVERIVDEVLPAHEGLEKRGGKMVFELRPTIDWDKGKAVRWLLGALRLDGPEILPIYVGDDLTDEDAFRELTGDGVGIVVGRPDRPTFAQFGLEDIGEVEQFLRQLSDRSSDEGR